MEQAQKDALKVQALTQRIAQLVAQYEEQLADFRAEATGTIQELQQETTVLKNRIEFLETPNEVTEDDVVEPQAAHPDEK